jgi:glucose/arabinose dehydrogenase
MSSFANWLRHMRNIWPILSSLLIGACSSSDYSSGDYPLADDSQNLAVSLTEVFTDTTFVRPLLVVQAPGDAEHLIVVEQDGAIYRVNRSGTPVKSLFSNLSDLVDSGASETGLLGIAFHPDYATNRQVFVSYTTSDDPVSDTRVNLRSRISRFVATPDGTALDTSVRRDLLEQPQPFSNHNGGHIAFHPVESYLYFGLGDGGSGGDPQNNAQNTNSLLGKILRIDVNVTDDEWNAGTHYKIPVGNPYTGGGGLSEIYALGLRNPWRWSFDRLNNELWAGDVGEALYEEIDRITLGGNFGWHHREGAHCYEPSAGCQSEGLIEPLVEYSHASGRCSVTGGYVYRGNLISGLRGQYIYGDYCTGEIWAIPTATANPTPQLLLDSSYFISSFGEDDAGEIYVLHHSQTGNVYRLTATASPY